MDTSKCERSMISTILTYVEKFSFILRTHFLFVSNTPQNMSTIFTKKILVFNVRKYDLFLVLVHNYEND